MKKHPSAGTSSDESMALSVTRHAQISVEPVEWKYLYCGIDTLDIGFYVNWDSTWGDVRHEFDIRKQQAQLNDGLIVDLPNIEKHLFMASGKNKAYRYHLQFPEYHMYVAIRGTAGGSPNVYVSLNSETISRRGIDSSVAEVVKVIHSFGGNIFLIQPSRVDLCVDYKVPGGLPESFIRSHAVCRSDDIRTYVNREGMGTIYFGALGAPLMLRFYDKGKEIANKGNEERWLSQWGIDDPTDVWRVEFQIRRKVLRQLKINTMDDLKRKCSGTWKYLTGEWFSLRSPTNQNTSRRPVHELWGDVQDKASCFGPDGEVHRQYKADPKMSLKWYVSRLATMYIACAAILGDRDPGRVARRLQSEILIHLAKKDFAYEWEKKSITMGIDQQDKSVSLQDGDSTSFNHDPSVKHYKIAIGNKAR
ncbi:MAG: plasmid replication initiation factor [Deltaproteobacteria bacterium]|nr:plasmid replication initiation factor [Deltaproteobacteria bacterium]MBN2686981.1 plasmid replication initiation factor [Deltaproteobacteria bacterium]